MQIKRKVKILDFDIENRPLSYWTPDRPTAEITAIASCWADDPDSIEVHLLQPREGEFYTRQMLEAFRLRYDEADIVTGHYITRHDLPIINGAMLEYGYGNLAPKLASDTRTHMFKKGDLPATQEYLCELFEIELPKVQMTQHKWREANRLTPEGLQATEKRVVGDVLQHMALREYMYTHGHLKPPKVWRP